MLHPVLLKNCMAWLLLGASAGSAPPPMTLTRRKIGNGSTVSGRLASWCRMISITRKASRWTGSSRIYWRLGATSFRCMFGGCIWGTVSLSLILCLILLRSLSLFQPKTLPKWFTLFNLLLILHPWCSFQSKLFSYSVSYIALISLFHSPLTLVALSVTSLYLSPLPFISFSSLLRLDISPGWMRNAHHISSEWDIHQLTNVSIVWPSLNPNSNPYSTSCVEWGVPTGHCVHELQRLSTGL